MRQTAFSSLPEEWQSWITDNLARSCDPASLAELMVSSGNFDSGLAQAAIREAMTSKAGAPALHPLPDIDTGANIVQTPDRQVQILTTLINPRIVVLGNVLGNDECDALAAYSDQRMERSPVVADADGSMQLHAHRTSSGAMLQRGETELIARVEARLALLANWPVERGEGMQVLRYEPGHEYRSHFDWFDADAAGPRKHLERGGQRLGTFVLYLSDVEQGGGTTFPAVGLEVQPQKGGGVFFINTDAALVPDRRTLHAGSPVVRGVKFVANKWLRERAYE